MTKLEKFIEKANKKHNNKFNYSLVNYINSKTIIKIICPSHGVFDQRPDHHLNLKYGCPRCSKNKKLTLNDYIKKVNKKHNKNIDYSETVYKNIHSDIKYKCKIHGIIKQNALLHLKTGCPHCKKSKKEIFIEKANKKHNNKYDYSLVEYKNSSTNVKIICPVHGIFEQLPNNHLMKSGCPRCALKIKRLKRIKEIEIDKFNGNQIIPSYNKKGCEILNNIMIKNNVFIQHAMNGGEYYIEQLGYWLDGYDNVNNIAYEIDEKHHFKNNKLLEKDIIRQKEITNFLNCKFIRIKI